MSLCLIIKKIKQKIFSISHQTVRSCTVSKIFFSPLLFFFFLYYHVGDRLYRTFNLCGYY